jgi:hypothetical protein
MSNSQDSFHPDRYSSDLKPDAQVPGATVVVPGGQHGTHGWQGLDTAGCETTGADVTIGVE